MNRGIWYHRAMSHTTQRLVSLPCFIFFLLTLLGGESSAFSNVSTVIGRVANKNDPNKDGYRLGDFSSIAFDDDDNLFVGGYCKVHKISARDGSVTVIAGTDICGDSGDEGQAIEASLWVVDDLLFDSAANRLLIADGENGRVRSVSLDTGVISTIAGGGPFGSFLDFSNFAGGIPATDLLLEWPNAIAFDSSSRLHIGCRENDLIWKIDDSGKAFLVAGEDGYGYPYNYDIDFDASDNLYIITSNSIRSVTANAGFSYQATSMVASVVGSDSPIKVIASNIYYSTYLSTCVQKYSLSLSTIDNFAGNCTKYGYSGDGGYVNATEMGGKLWDIAVDSIGDFYIADNSFGVVRKVNMTDNTVSTYAGVSNYGGDGGLASEATISMHIDSGNANSFAVDKNGNIFISDYSNHRIRRVDSQTQIITTIAGTGVPTNEHGYGDGGKALAARFYETSGIAVDPSGNVYIGDGSLIRLVNVSTGIITKVAGVKHQYHQYTYANGIEVCIVPENVAAVSAVVDAYSMNMVTDGLGNLYVAERYCNRIRVINASTGNISTIAGNGAEMVAGDGGHALNASLFRPTLISFTQDGHLIVGGQSEDNETLKLRHINMDTLIINSIDIGSSQTQNEFAVDLDNDLLFYDDLQGKIYRSSVHIGAANNPVAIAGNGMYGHHDGEASSAMFSRSVSVRVSTNDSYGSYWVMDNGNACVRRVNLADSPTLSPTSLPSSLPTSLSAPLLTEGGGPPWDKGLIMIALIAIGAIVACMTAYAPAICKNIHKGESKSANPSEEKNGCVYELTLREIDRSNDLAAVSSNSDCANISRKKRRKSESYERIDIKSLDLQRRIERIHEESLRQAERKLEFDTIF